jgi:hypothetical protein
LTTQITLLELNFSNFVELNKKPDLIFQRVLNNLALAASQKGNRAEAKVKAKALALSKLKVIVSR